MKTGQSLRIHRKLEMLLKHPQFTVAAKIIAVLQGKGFQTVLAGGCVRDGVLGRTPKDLDIATAAPPEVVESSFDETLAVGKAFGTIVVLDDGHAFEVTTFRREGPYKDGRHPDHVEFTDMKEDAERRDFTVNAMFYDPVEEEIFDFVGGLKDLEDGVLKTVGVAAERFNEDKLRMLRAPRFVAQLGFELESKTLSAIRSQAAAISGVSSERVFNEMRRFLSSPHFVRGLEVLRSSQLEDVIWPEMALADLGRLAKFPPLSNWETVFAAVMLLAGEEEFEMRLRAWKAPRESLRLVQTYIAGCKALMNPATTRAGRVRILGSAEFADILQLVSGFLVGRDDVVQGWIAEFLKIAQLGKLPAPFLNGQDLIAAGVPPGEKMGQILKRLYDEQLDGLVTTRESALESLTKLKIALLWP